MAGLAGTIQTALMFSGSKWAATKCCPALLKKKKKKKKKEQPLVWSSDRSEHCSVSTPKHPGCFIKTKVASLNNENKRFFYNSQYKRWTRGFNFYQIKTESHFLPHKVILFNCIRCFLSVFSRVGVPIDFGLYLLVLYAW